MAEPVMSEHDEFIRWAKKNLDITLTRWQVEVAKRMLDGQSVQGPRRAGVTTVTLALEKFLSQR